MCMLRTFLTEHEVTNEITISTVFTVHGLPVPGRPSTELVSLSFLSGVWRLCSLQLNLKFSQQLPCSVSFKPLQIFNQNVVFFIWTACLQTHQWRMKIRHFRHHEKLQSKASKHEVWCEITIAFRSEDYWDICVPKILNIGVRVAY